MAVYREDLVDIELESGSIHRSFLNHAIGKGDNMGNRFGVRLYRNKEPVNLGVASCMGVFMAPDGTNIALTSQYAGGNIAYVTLPQVCYNVEGQFSLAIKVIQDGVVETMRIVDGVVDNTGVDGAVAPVDTIPTYQEILAVYDEMLEAIAGSVRYDIEQELDTEERAQARSNIGMVLIEFAQIQGNEYLMDVSTECEFVNVQGNEYMLVMHAD